jgi:hypothetical protein
MQEPVKHTVDAAAAGIAVTTVLGWLPAIAAAFTIVWTAIRIWETKTVQDFVATMRGRR